MSNSEYFVSSSWQRQILNHQPMKSGMQMESVLDAFNPKNNKLNWSLVTIPFAVYFSLDYNLTMAFLFSMIAIMPLGFFDGKGTEEIALRTGEAIEVS